MFIKVQNNTFIYLVLHKDAQGEEEVTYASYNQLSAERAAHTYAEKFGEEFYVKAETEAALGYDQVQNLRKAFNF